MEIIDFLILAGVFKSRNEATKTIKNKVTLKINGVDINENHLGGKIFLDKEKLKITQK